eukprot:gene10401-19211_t
MDVNNKIFDSVYPEIKQALDECEFYAMDLEMTGITPTVRPSPVDPPAKSYASLKN